MAEIMGIFMLRAYYYIATHKKHWVLENISQDLEGYTFGRIEGVNLFKAVRDKFTNGFIKFLKRFIFCPFHFTAYHIFRLSIIHKAFYRYRSHNFFR